LNERAVRWIQCRILLSKIRIFLKFYSSLLQMVVF